MTKRFRLLCSILFSPLAIPILLLATNYFLSGYNLTEGHFIKFITGGFLSLVILSYVISLTPLAFVATYIFYTKKGVDILIMFLTITPTWCLSAALFAFVMLQRFGHVIIPMLAFFSMAFVAASTFSILFGLASGLPWKSVPK